MRKKVIPHRIRTCVVKVFQKFLLFWTGIGAFWCKGSHSQRVFVVEHGNIVLKTHNWPILWGSLSVQCQGQKGCTRSRTQGVLDVRHSCWAEWVNSLLRWWQAKKDALEDTGVLDVRHSCTAVRVNSLFLRWWLAERGLEDTKREGVLDVRHSYETVWVCSLLLRWWLAEV